MPRLGNVLGEPQADIFTTSALITQVCPTAALPAAALHSYRLCHCPHACAATAAAARPATILSPLTFPLLPGLITGFGIIKDKSAAATMFHIWTGQAVTGRMVHAACHALQGPVRLWLTLVCEEAPGRGWCSAHQGCRSWPDHHCSQQDASRTLGCAAAGRLPGTWKSRVEP